MYWLRWHYHVRHCRGTVHKKLSCRRETARRFVSLNILLSHSKLLKIIRNDAARWDVRKSLLVVHENYVCISYCSEIFSVKEWRDLETGCRVFQGHWKWRCSIDQYDFLLVGHCKYSSMLYHFRVIWCWIIVTLTSRLWVTEGYSNWYHSEALVQFPIRLPYNYGSILHHF